MNKVINNILFTKIYVSYDDGITPETDSFNDFAIELDTINSFYDLTGRDQKDILQNKVKLVTCSNLEYVIDMSFSEFKNIYLKYKTETNNDFMKNIFINKKN